VPVGLLSEFVHGVIFPAAAGPIQKGVTDL
jgi:hypothetical protein